MIDLPFAPDIALGALRLGPAVLPGERAVALAALLAFIAVSEFTAWRARRRTGERAGEPGEVRRPAAPPATELDRWAWGVVLWGGLGARLAWVVAHAESYLRDPLAVLAIWQGGFAPWGFALGAAVVTLVRLRRRGDAGRALRVAAGPVAVAAAVAGGALLLLADAAPPPRLAELRDPLPSLAGGELAPAELAGSPVVINLWATWCGPCRREMPRLLRAAAREAERAGGGVRFLLIDQGESAERVRGYLASLPGAPDADGLAGALPGAEVLLDRRGAAGAWARSPGLPTTLFFGADGELRDRVLGELSAARLETGVAEIRGSAGDGAAAPEDR